MVPQVLGMSLLSNPLEDCHWCIERIEAARVDHSVHLARCTVDNHVMRVGVGPPPDSSPIFCHECGNYVTHWENE